MKKLVVILALLALGACSSWQSATVSTVKPQQTVDLLRSIETAALRAEVIYIKQPGCGLVGSPPAPLCASYAVGLKMHDLNAKADKAIGAAQTAIDTAGTNPTVIDAAVAAARLAVTELQTFASTSGIKI